jgi:hypothetical protein
VEGEIRRSDRCRAERGSARSLPVCDDAVAGPRCRVRRAQGIVLAAVAHPDPGASGFNVFVDGGLWANNPVLVGLIDALDLTERGQEVHVFCLGTCPLPAGEQIAKDRLDRGLLDWKFGGEAAGLSIDAQQFAFDHMAKKLARHVDRLCEVVRFPSDKVPAALIPYLGLDETRPEGFEALINQAGTDADMNNSKSDKDHEAALICSLFESAPQLTNPLVSRRSAGDSSSTGDSANYSLAFHAIVVAGPHEWFIGQAKKLRIRRCSMAKVSPHGDGDSIASSPSERCFTHLRRPFAIHNDEDSICRGSLRSRLMTGR